MFILEGRVKTEFGRNSKWFLVGVPRTGARSLDIVSTHPSDDEKDKIPSLLCIWRGAFKF
jgi:hypothetical protein